MKGQKSDSIGKLELFAEWLAAPEEEREIKTQKEFAESIGIDEHTLIRWKAKLAETDTVDELARFRAHVYKLAMRSNATAKHMELYAKLKGLMEKTEGKDTMELTGDNLKKFLLKAEREARRYLREHGYGGWYDKEEIEGIMQYAKDKGLIKDFKKVPPGKHKVFKDDGRGIDPKDYPRIIPPPINVHRCSFKQT